jgi:3-methyladenine DNA glycosylase Tag
MPHWFVAIDTVRLRRSITGAHARAVNAALAPAAVAARVRLVEAAVIGSGVRAVVAADRPQVRVFARRFIALARRQGVSWRQTFRLAALAPAAVPAARALLREMKNADEEAPMIATSSTAKRAGDCRKLSTLVRHVERSVDSALGSDEAAKRVRRYVSEHDAPPDDRVAFGRLCMVIFAQGIGYEAVAARADGFAQAFSGYDPDAVASYDEKRVESLLSAPIVRNAAKIDACVENARRWVALAKKHGTYLGRIANAAAVDDPATGWTALNAMLRDDFVHLGESTSGQVLKHLGFFTAFAHPGARRVIERLGFIDAGATAPALQKLLGAVAQRLGRDPYALEATLALFAGIGPCKKKPACDACELADKCPSANVSA